MEAAAFGLISGATGGISLPLIGNVLAVTISWWIVNALKERLTRAVMYRRIRMRSLGFGASVLYDGERYKINDISEKFGTVTLENARHLAFVPLATWVSMVKVVPKNGATMGEPAKPPPISIACTNSPDSSETCLPTAWMPSTR